MSQTVQLYEYVTSGPGLTVDREAGVVRGVKILGHQSANGREYTDEAMRKAAGLYEGRGVFCDHRVKSAQPRSVRDKLGWLESVSHRPGQGLYGDLHVFKTHQMAGPLFEAGERRPDQFGLSHDATGTEQRGSRGKVIESIESVASVDLVNDPATVRGLSESRSTMSTLRERIEASPADPAIKASLLEAAGDMADAPVGGDGRGMLAAAVAALVQSEDAGDHELAKKVMKLLKPEAAPEGGGEKPVDESRKPAAPAPDAAGLTEARVKALCKLAGVEPEAALLESLTGASDDKAMKLLEWAKGRAQPLREQRGPRSQGPGRPPAPAGAVPDKIDRGWLTGRDE